MSIAADSHGANAVRSRLAGLLQPIGRLIAQFREHRRIRRDALTLLDLDDRMLVDIGLHRSVLLGLAERGARPRRHQAWTHASSEEIAA